MQEESKEQTNPQKINFEIDYDDVSKFRFSDNFTKTDCFSGFEHITHYTD